jgi:hypothetical protein
MARLLTEEKRPAVDFDVDPGSRNDAFEPCGIAAGVGRRLDDEGGKIPLGRTFTWTTLSGDGPLVTARPAPVECCSTMMYSPSWGRIVKGIHWSLEGVPG